MRMKVTDYAVLDADLHVSGPNGLDVRIIRTYPLRRWYFELDGARYRLRSSFFGRRTQLLDAADRLRGTLDFGWGWLWPWPYHAVVRASGRQLLICWHLHEFRVYLDGVYVDLIHHRAGEIEVPYVDEIGRPASILVALAGVTFLAGNRFELTAE